MRPSPSEKHPGPWRYRALVLPGLLLGLGSLAAGCLELNSDFNPDAGPPCTTGERQCGPEEVLVQLCNTLSVWVEDRACWVGTSCVEGGCQPNDAGGACTQGSDCGAQLCTVVVDPAAADSLATFCLPPPNQDPDMKASGEACGSHDQCAIGWCFRQVCFEACTDTAQCTNPLHECALLDITVDGVRDNANIRGCVPPA